MPTALMSQELEIGQALNRVKSRLGDVITLEGWNDILLPAMVKMCQTYYGGENSDWQQRLANLGVDRNSYTDPQSYITALKDRCTSSSYRYLVACDGILKHEGGDLELGTIYDLKSDTKFFKDMMVFSKCVVIFGYFPSKSSNPSFYLYLYNPTDTFDDERANWTAFQKVLASSNPLEIVVVD